MEEGKEQEARRERSDSMTENSGKPVDRREADMIWEDLKQFKELVASSHKDIRQNFHMVFEKLDTMRDVMSSIYATKIEVEKVERRVDKLESNNTPDKWIVSARSMLSDIHKVAVILAIVVGAIWFLIRFGME